MGTPALLHSEIETTPPGTVAAMQEQLWQAQWDYVRTHSTFYRRRLGEAAGRPVTLNALRDLPLTDKEEIRASQEASPPYGDYVACALERVVRIHRTSGTTGRSLNIAFSQRDVDVVTRLGGRAMFCAGARPGLRIVHCLNYQLWTGGVTDHMIIEASGATAVPFGVGNTRKLLETITELGVTGIHCTPSYPALLEKVLREEMGREPRSLALRLGLFGGEAGLDNRAFRDRLEETWGFKVRNANFGLSEVMSILGGQCEHTSDLHYHAADGVFAELLDPASGERLPIREGATGELVCTHLAKECQPLVRYRTRDVLTVTETGPCACGRATWRFRVTGRTDDMFNVRGVNVFPTSVQRVVTEAGDLTSGQFRIVLAGPGPYDRIAMRVEAALGMPPERWPSAAAELARRIRATIGASAEVTMLPFEALPRTEGKTRLVEREPS
ncbi:MAG TPA: AMP-binding protein [Methylomirabilota bacterium]